MTAARSNWRQGERLPMSAYQAPRMACLSEIRHAWKSGNPISGDAKYHDGFVYVAIHRESGLVKVGLSNQPEKRMKQLSKEAGSTVDLMATFKGNRQEELILLEKLATWRVKGEWFNPNANEFWSIVDLHFANHGVSLPSPPSPVDGAAQI